MPDPGQLSAKLKAHAARNEWPLFRAGIYAGAAGFAALALLFGPTHLMELTETPEFCGLCHSMKPQHSDWKHSSHRQALAQAKNGNCSRNCLCRTGS